MKKILIFVFLILGFAVKSWAQQSYVEIDYGYNNSGDRIYRHIIIIPQKIKAPSQSDSTFNEGKTLAAGINYIKGHKIKVWPNPTDGKLMVTISNIENFDKGYISVFNDRGQKLINKLIASSVDLDLSNYSAGIYILKVSIDNIEDSWKVEKQ